MRPLTLNLARRPFANVRPVFRATLALWVIGAILLGVNMFFYWRHFSGEGQSERIMGDIADRVEAERNMIAGLEKELAGFELERQNELVLFLNEKIAERTFSWSALFDDLAEALPPDVQLERVTPKFGGRRTGRRRRPAEDLELVSLSLNGQAKGGQEMHAFVDALFDHPRFREPSPTSESRREDSTDLSFSLTVSYLPRRPEPALPVAPPEAALTEPIEEGDAP